MTVVDPKGELPLPNGSPAWTAVTFELPNVAVAWLLPFPLNGDDDLKLG